MKIRYPNIFAGITLLVFSLALLVKSQAQQTIIVQVLVAGPWSYVEDPYDTSRIVIIAPYEKHHFNPGVGPDPDLNDASQETSTPQGSYHLDIGNINCTGAKPPQTPKPPQVFPIMGVDVENVIKPAVQGPKPLKPRFAFSLPKPCFYQDLMDRFEILQLDKPIPNTPTNSNPQTVLMALQYLVTANTPAEINGTSDDGQTTYKKKDVPFVQLGGSVPSIHVIMRGPIDNNDDTDCDPISNISVRLSAALFQRTLHVWLPALDYAGGQTTFQANCQDANPSDGEFLRIHAFQGKGLGSQTDVPDCTRETLPKVDLVGNPFLAKETLRWIVLFEKFAQHPVPGGASARILKCIETNTQALGFTKSEPVQKEINAANALLDELNEKGKLTSTKKKRSGLVFPETLKQIMILTPTTGDCSGSQLGINGQPK